MTTATDFRDKMDVALRSADATRGMGGDYRRTMLMQDLERAGLVLMDRQMFAGLMERVSREL